MACDVNRDGHQVEETENRENDRRRHDPGVGLPIVSPNPAAVPTHRQTAFSAGTYSGSDAATAGTLVIAATASAGLSGRVARLRPYHRRAPAPPGW